MFSEAIYEIYDDEYYETKQRQSDFYYCDIIYSMSTQNKYARMYIWLVQDCICRGFSKKIVSQKLNGEYLEMHHIVPRSFDPSYEKSKQNIVPMTAREHYIAHLLLTKMFCEKTQSKFYYKSLNAIQKFWQNNSKQDRRLKNHQYETLRKLARENVKNGPLKESSKSPTLGKKCYNDGIRNIFINPGDNVPDGFVAGSAQKGYIGITDGINNMAIPSTDTIPNGFWRGSSQKGKPSKLKNRKRLKYDSDAQRNLNNSNAHKDTIWITNGVDDTMIKNTDDIPIGWMRGRTKQNTLTDNKVCCCLCDVVIDIGNFVKHYDSKKCKIRKADNENKSN